MPETKRFYHFMRAEHALQAIERRRLKLTNLAETNDPYECLPFSFCNCEEEKDFLRFRETARNQLGAICFSKIFHDPLLWGHYADNIKGICLGFDIDVYDSDDKNIIIRVKYVTDRSNRNDFADLIRNYRFDNKIQNNRDTKEGRKVLDQHKNLYFTKSDHWKYEKEWRVCVPLGERDPVSGLYFDDFGDQKILREILVGFRCIEEFPDIKSRLDKLVTSYPDPPDIFFTRRSLGPVDID